MDKLPQDNYNSQTKASTVAYQAERELDELIYKDSGLYRDRQFSKANIINLQTMYEEIKILWDQELKYRPSFSTADGVVNIPVLYAKISGVKDGNKDEYWQTIKELFSKDTLLITRAPFIKSDDNNPMKSYARDFYRDGKLLRKEIKRHPDYPYAIIREDVQEFMLDKLEAMLSQKRIAGTGENGTEYAVIAQVLNLPKSIVRLIQQFDFTKKNPKLIYINAGENAISLEDTILTAYLNMIGFDVLFFVPTGYQSVERFLAQNLMEDHQIGEYMYDMTVPDLAKLSLKNTRHSWRDKIFKRGE
jgi:hypothetical protein